MRSVREIVEEAFAHHGAGRHAEAAEIYEKLLGYTDGNDPNVLYAYGTLLLQNGKEGLGSYLLLQMIKQFPDHAPAWCNYGVAMHHLGRDDVALKAYEQSLQIEPNSAETLSNFAGFYQNRGTPELAVEYGAKAVALAPDSPAANNHLALGLMELGRFEEAWPHYKHRWDLPERIKDRRPYKAPLWQGQRVGTLSIHGEQGLGDEILVMGCLAATQTKVDRVIVECSPRLVDWFSESLSVKCYGTHNELIAAEGEPDAYISMYDLPSIVGWHDGRSYLRRPHVGPRPTPRIGIAWRGGVPKTGKKDRTQKLEALRPILDVRGIDFVSVQYGEENVEAEAASAGLFNGIRGRDIESINQWIASCDLIITPPQTAFHQAGAMGIPCWMMVPWRRSWQCCSDDEQSRFYKSVKHYRQETDGVWTHVIRRIAADVERIYGKQAKYG